MITNGIKRYLNLSLDVSIGKITDQAKTSNYNEGLLGDGQKQRVMRNCKYIMKLLISMLTRPLDPDFCSHHRFPTTDSNPRRYCKPSRSINCYARLVFPSCLSPMVSWSVKKELSFQLHTPVYDCALSVNSHSKANMFSWSNSSTMPTRCLHSILLDTFLFFASRRKRHRRRVNSSANVIKPE